MIVMDCQILTSSGRSSSSGMEVLRRRLRLTFTFLLGSSSQSESTRMEVQVELATLPPTLLDTVTSSRNNLQAKIEKTSSHRQSFFIIQCMTLRTHILSRRKSTELRSQSLLCPV